jgi:hypothetical protein
MGVALESDVMTELDKNESGYNFALHRRINLAILRLKRFPLWESLT